MQSFSPHRLRSARESAGLRREHVAVDVERSYATITKYETGEVDPPATMIAKLAETIGCDVADLFADEPVPA